MDLKRKISRRALIASTGLTSAAMITGGWLAISKRQAAQDTAGNGNAFIQTVEETKQNIGDMQELGPASRSLTRALVEQSVNVKDFGATGDGTTDDTIALQRAMAYLESLGGGELYFPAGVYMVTRTLAMKSYCHIRGTKTSVIKTTWNTELISGIDLQHIRIQGIKLEKFNLGKGAIRFQNCNYIVIEDVWIVAEDLTYPAYSQGIDLRESNYIHILRNHVDGTRGHCLVIGTSTLNAVAECKHIVIRDNLFENYGHTESGMAMDISGGYNSAGEIYYVRDCIIDGNTFRNGRRNGLKLQIVENCLFINNRVENNAELGLILNAQNRPTKEVIVANNSFKNNGNNLNILSHAQDEETQQVTITQNEFIDAKLSEILISQAGGLLNISNNKFSNRTGQASLEIRTTYGDRGTLHFENNLVDHCDVVLKRLPWRSYINGNTLRASSRIVVDDDAARQQPIDCFLFKNNHISGPAETAIYTSKQQINSISVTGNTFQDMTAGTIIDFRAPYDDGRTVFKAESIIIKDNEILTDKLTQPIRIESTYQEIVYGVVKNNVIRASSGAQVVHPRSVTVQGNETIPTKPMP